MSGPWIGVGINRPSYAPSWLTIYDRAFRLGPADIRPCGCAWDPIIFGHLCGKRS